VLGALGKHLGGGPATATFEIGSTSGYAPVELVVQDVTTPGVVVASSRAGDHPALATSTLDPARTVNRVWSVGAAGAWFDTARAVFHFPAEELDAAAAWTRLVVRRHLPSGWSWLDTGARTPTSVEALGITMLGDFAAGDIPAWSLAATAVGSGTVAKTPDQPRYDTGTEVTLTAEPEPGHAFAGWEGDTVAVHDTLRLTLDRDWSVIARFTAPEDSIDRFPVDVEPNGPGSILRSPDLPSYPAGTSVTLIPVAAPGYRFAWWSGDTSGADQPLTLVVARPRALIACFRIQNHVLETTPGPWGAILREPDLGAYEHGMAVTLTARPGPGSRFLGWSGDTTAADSSLSLIMTRDRHIVARFTDALTGTVDGEVAEFRLGPVLPNPMRGRATIEYALPEAAWIRLAILDLQGREVAVLARGFHPAGRHRARWDGRVEGGNAAPGIYFVRLERPGKEHLRRLALVR
jgi:hypothetical protein